MKFQITKAETSVILTVFIQDSSATDGSGLGGLDESSSIVGGYVKRNSTGLALAVDQNVTTEGTYEAPTTDNQVRIGTPANMRTGTYELHFHNDLFTTADWVTVTLGGAANMAELTLEIQLVDMLVNDSTLWQALSDQFDGVTGLDGDTYPGTQAQANNITAAGSATKEPAILSPNGFVITWGENEVNTEDATRPLDGTTHDIEAQNDAGTQRIDTYYEHNIGSGVPSEVTIHGYLDKGGGAAKNILIQAENVDASTWRTIGTIQSSTSIETHTFDLFTSEVGTGGDFGTVRIRFLTGSVAFSATTKMLVDQIFVSQNPGAVSSLDAVYFDSAASNTNTGQGDGIPGNPVSTMGAVNTLLTARNLHRIEVASGSTVTLAATQNNQIFSGTNWTLALQSQDIAGSHFTGASVSGLTTGTGTMQTFKDCILNAVVHIKNTHCVGCWIDGTQTVGEAGDYFFAECRSGIAGTATWIFDFGGVGNTNFNLRSYSGGVQLESMGNAGVDTASIEGFGQIIEGTCTGGTVAVRGLFTTSGISNLTLVEAARYPALLPTALVNGRMDSNASAIGDSAPAAVNLKQASLAMQVITVQTAEASANTDTIFDTDLPLEANDYYGSAAGGLVAVFVGGTAQQYQSRRIIASATGTLNTRITVDEAFAGIPGDGDTMIVLGRIEL